MALDPAIEILDKRFYQLVIHNAHIDGLWTGARWTEGPVYVPAGRYLLFSDIPNDRTLRYDELTGTVTTFEQPALNQNGHCLDLEGRVVSCEHRGRAVSRIGHHGQREVLADSWEGKRLNSPNDVVVSSDGGVWFTDPTYGIDSGYEGDRAESEIGHSYVYRIDADGSISAVITDMVRPNGLAFSPDESLLYVADTGISHVGKACPPDIRAYPMAADGRSIAGPATTFATCTEGVFDGFRVDDHANLWTSAGDGVHCYDPDGTLIGKIHLPEVVANVEFGGQKRNRLYICATTSLFAFYLNTRAASRPNRRPPSGLA
ncbi:MAG: SMP-30/gluconolactonase/LRE family protein [Actinomycetia bacterium]|nr:SMP-30/gluconolactonase/LRE family protein [Actinomycetes bacterium]